MSKISESFDFNFKLVIIEELLEKNPSFQSQIDLLHQKDIELFEKDYDETLYDAHTEEAYELLDKIEFTQEDLEKVESLTFDGGLEIYQLISPYWDGEDDRFDIHSIRGIELLTNLKSVEYISIIDEELIDEIESMGIEIC